MCLETLLPGLMVLVFGVGGCRGGGGSGDGDDDSADGGTGGDTGGPGDTGTADGDSDGGGESGEPQPLPPASSKATVKFKGPKRIRNDFATALTIDPEDVCLELGELSCTDEVHTVTLGGVEPRALGIYTPASQSTVTSPIAADRVALAACIERVDIDFKFPGGVIFYGFSVEGGAIVNPDGVGVRQSIARMYKRGLSRDATVAEIDHLRALYDEIAAAGSDAPARDWAAGTCFAVLTTMESLFY